MDPNKRLIVSITMIASLFSSGCASVGQTIGAGLAGTGLIATGTGALLAVGCSSPSQDNPTIQQSGQPCLPAETYETYKPAIVTSIALGLILIGTGIAVYTTSTPEPAKTRAPIKPPPEPPPESVETLSEKPCKDYCF